MSASIKAALLLGAIALAATAARSDGLGNMTGVLGQGTFGGIGGALKAPGGGGGGGCAGVIDASVGCPLPMLGM